MDQIKIFKAEVKANINKMAIDKDLQAFSRLWVRTIAPYNYAYNFSWLGRPIIQFPQDILAMEELIWGIKPDLIIECGIAHGGSLIMSASILALLDYCDAAITGDCLDPNKPTRKVLGIDIDIREHNRLLIEKHPMYSRIEMIQGSSTDQNIIDQVHTRAKSAQKIMVVLDSNHTHEHVLAELAAYAPLVSVGSYCIVFDTLIEDMPAEMFPDRPWGKGDNPKTAVWNFINSLKKQPVLGIDGLNLNFEIDHTIEHKLLITAAPDGFLKRV